MNYTSLMPYLNVAILALFAALAAADLRATQIALRSDDS